MPKYFTILNAERSLILASIVICVTLSLSKLLEGLDQFVYDNTTPFLGDPVASDIALISVDDESINEFGRWPWTRNVHASLLEKLNEVSPRMIILNFLFSEQEQPPQTEELKKLREKLLSTNIYKRNVNSNEPEYVTGGSWLNANFISDNPDNIKRKQYVEMKNAIVDSLAEIDQHINETTSTISGDLRLSKEIQRQTPVLMPLYFHPNREFAATPQYVTSNTATFLVQGSFSTQRQNLPHNMESVIYPIAEFGKHSNMMGHINDSPDSDGQIRSHTLLLHHNGQLYPSLALTAAAAHIGYSMKDILYQPGGGVILGTQKYHTDENLSILPSAYMQSGAEKPFEIFSYANILSGITSMDTFHDKTVILGITANSLSAHYKAGKQQHLSPSELLAFNITSLTKMQFYYTPPLSKALIWLLFITISIFFFIASYRMKMKHWIALTLTSIIVTLFVQIFILKTMKIWLPLSPLYALYTLGFLFVNLWKLSISEKTSLQRQIESSENNRVLGLTYQNQGQLDLAFDKFKRCTPDASIADTLYGLGLDFERKRLKHKASLVYQYIESINPSFKDVTSRIDAIEDRQPQTPNGTTENNIATAHRPTHSAMLELPTFGRYQIQREIGKGGMGAVYLGKDPKIDREVAIKTLKFSNEYSGDLLIEAKKRFAREAKAVGKLNHRNIVTIYDVGEDHDLAYIAMEYLPGLDLSAHIKSDKLLPLKETIRIGVLCADALAYAHKAGVVHRDIKPSNIIYQQETRKVCLTDFGIALLLDGDASRTSSTIGSPSYMSPEQIKGETLDGRSDIYSLGVTLFQLLAAQLPYEKEDASALTYSIVHTPTPELSAVKEGIPGNISNVIFKSMQKDKNKRYTTAAEMRDALRACFSSQVKNSDERNT